MGGVCRNSPGFPQRLDGDLRRPGMVNFKALPRPPEPRLLEVPRELLAKRLALQLAPHGLQMAQLELRLAALAGLLALLVDELNGCSVLALLAAEEELEVIASNASAFSPTGGA